MGFDKERAEAISMSRRERSIQEGGRGRGPWLAY